MTIERWKIWGNVPAESVVPDGFRERKAPEEPGLYSLFELVDVDENTHQGFVWERQIEAETPYEFPYRAIQFM